MEAVAAIAVIGPMVSAMGGSTAVAGCVGAWDRTLTDGAHLASPQRSVAAPGGTVREVEHGGERRPRARNLPPPYEPPPPPHRPTSSGPCWPERRGAQAAGRPRREGRRDASSSPVGSGHSASPGELVDLVHSFNREVGHATRRDRLATTDPAPLGPGPANPVQRACRVRRPGPGPTRLDRSAAPRCASPAAHGRSRPTRAGLELAQRTPRLPFSSGRRSRGH